MTALAQTGEPDRDVFALPGWWDEGSRAYASLRAVNALRLQILGTWLEQWFGSPRALQVVDLGCGGGLMSVPLARAGAAVIAVDRCRPALREGRAHARGGVQFVQGDVCAAPLPDGCADLVLLSDVLEHLDEPARAVATAARLLRPGGHLFVNTINRTLRARVLAIWLAEGLGLIPRGTHRARQFVRPDELRAMARSVSLHATDWCGEQPALWTSLRQRVVHVRAGRSLAVGYCAAFRREAP